MKVAENSVEVFPVKATETFGLHNNYIITIPTEKKQLVKRLLNTYTGRHILDFA